MLQARNIRGDGWSNDGYICLNLVNGWTMQVQRYLDEMTVFSNLPNELA